MRQDLAIASQLKRDKALLGAIKAELPELERLLEHFSSQYEDSIYRFYHQSFKVYSLQGCTVAASKVFTHIGDATNNRISQWFEQIVADGVGVELRMEHNKDWLSHTRPIVKAFLHAKYFLEMMVKSARGMDSPTTVLPSGWAAILELYKQR